MVTFWRGRDRMTGMTNIQLTPLLKSNQNQTAAAANQEQDTVASLLFSPRRRRRRRRHTLVGERDASIVYRLRFSRRPRRSGPIRSSELRIKTKEVRMEW